MTKRRKNTKDSNRPTKKTTTYSPSKLKLIKANIAKKLLNSVDSLKDFRSVLIKAKSAFSEEKLIKLINATKEGNEPLLIICVSKRNQAIIKLLLEFEINFNVTDAHGNTALHILAQSKSTNEKDDSKIITIAELLIKAGTDTYAQNVDGKTASELLRDNLNIPESIKVSFNKLLVDQVDILSKQLEFLNYIEDETALAGLEPFENQSTKYLESSQDPFIETYIRHSNENVDQDNEGIYNFNGLITAQDKFVEIDWQEELINSLEKLSKFTAFCNKAKQGIGLEKLRELINNIRLGSDEKPVLLLYVCEHTVQAVDLLSGLRVDFNVTDGYGNTALHKLAQNKTKKESATYRMITIFQLLLTKVDVNTKNDTGFTALELLRDNKYLLSSIKDKFENLLIIKINQINLSSPLEEPDYIALNKFEVKSSELRSYSSSETYVSHFSNSLDQNNKGIYKFNMLVTSENESIKINWQQELLTTSRSFPKLKAICDKAAQRSNLKELVKHINSIKLGANDRPLFFDYIDTYTVTTLKLLLDLNIDFNVTDGYGNTVLHKLAQNKTKKESATYRMITMFQLLLTKVDVNTKNDTGFTALELLRNNKHLLSLIKYKFESLLIEQISNVNITEKPAALIEYLEPTNEVEVAPLELNENSLTEPNVIDLSGIDSTNSEN